MIPTNQELRKRITLGGSSYILLETDYFKKAEQFVQLQTIFIQDSYVGKISLWVDMIVSPIISIIMFCMYGETPSMFSLLSFQKCGKLWYQWFEFKILAEEIRVWRQIIKDVKGPFIATNDPTYQVYVYADAMERLRSSLLGLSKKGAKCTK